MHKQDKTVLMEANAWNDTVCPKDGPLRFICEFKTSAKTMSVSTGKPKAVNRIRNTYTARCSGVGVSISANATSVGVGASISSTEVTNYVQNTNKSIADKAGSVTCHVDPLSIVLGVIAPHTKFFDRYTTGSYTEAWISGTADHTSWAVIKTNATNHP